MISVGILGASGYTGLNLVRLCSRHPHITELSLYAGESAGRSLYDVAPEMAGVVNNYALRPSNEPGDHDVIFMALPHGEAMRKAPEILSQGARVVDLGADFRLDAAKEFERVYGLLHTAPEWLTKKNYGLADFGGAGYSETPLIANPGCYPTAALLSLLPLASRFSDEILSVSINAYSGTSGAGKSAKAELMVSEMDGNVRAYNVHTHRHEAEIVQQLKKHGFDSPLSFTVHLLPVANGIYSTTSIHLSQAIAPDDILSAYDEAYSEKPFIRMREEPPHLRWVVGTNFCDLFVSVRGASVVITAAIDNLIKGAAGQAVQNMNKTFGWEETAGILEVPDVSVY